MNLLHRKASAIEAMTPPPPSRGSAFSDYPPSVVDMGDAALVQYWSQRLGATEDRIRKAIREVGRDHQIVQLYLSRASWPKARDFNQ